MIEFANRQGSDCYKWDSAEAQGTLPLWVADMDFKAASPILRALQKRLDHGVFGYNIVPDRYYEAVSNWFSRRHGWQGIGRRNSIPTTGVVPALSAVLKARTMALREKGDGRPLKVMTFTPAYNCFFSSIRNMEAELTACPLTEKDGHYEIDFEACERQIEGVDVLLLCNPHNPTGRVWTRDELLLLAGMCDFYGTYVISDEIHCELTLQGHPYTPYATVADDSDWYCVLTSASKAFNIAGLQCANIFTADRREYERIDRAINIHEVCDLNPFGVEATIAAYNECGEWIDELNGVIAQNRRLLERMTAEQMPQLRLTDQEGTYLAWADIRRTGIDADTFCRRLAAEEKVLLNASGMYSCEGFVRINLATSAEILTEALTRLARFVQSLNI